MNYTLPTVHLNGSSRERLFDGYHAAYLATVAARDALRMVDFHARDYYVVDGAWPQALKERTEVFNHLAEVMQYLEAHLAHLAPALSCSTPTTESASQSTGSAPSTPPAPNSPV